MKKLLSLFLLITTILTLSSCSNQGLKYSLKDKKPSTYYYTDVLVKEAKAHGISNVLVLETNLNKERNLKDEDVETLMSFFKSIKTKNFLASAPELTKNPEFRFYITTNGDKYVINVYNEKYIAIFPWDGAYSMDYIDMSSVKPLYNLYSLCKYLYKN
jgi:hypothetical protein